MNRVVLLLGANLGDELRLFEQVRLQIRERIGNESACSSVYVSPPWGFEHENNFHNQVIVTETHLDATDVLNESKQIERECGRTEKTKVGYEARVIDIDILFYNEDVIQTDELTIPHKLLHLRRFTLVPLCELMPAYVHPVLRKPCKELLVDCQDTSSVCLLQ